EVGAEAPPLDAPPAEARRGRLRERRGDRDEAVVIVQLDLADLRALEAPRLAGEGAQQIGGPQLVLAPAADPEGAHRGGPAQGGAGAAALEGEGAEGRLEPLLDEAQRLGLA